MTDELRNFLELSLPKVKDGKKPKFSLGVSEPKIGSHIFEVTKIPCQSNEFVLELLRGVREHIDRFIKDLKPGDFEKAHLGLGHSYSRAKVKFNVNRVDNMVIQRMVLLALFRALKTRGNTPKYGLIFHSSFIGRASARNKGRMARYLANKCSIASRIDCFADKSTTAFGEKLHEQVEERLDFYDKGVAPRKSIDVMKSAIETTLNGDVDMDDAPTEVSAKKIKKKKSKSEAVEDGEPATEDRQAAIINEDVSEEPKSLKKKKKEKRKPEQVEELEAAVIGSNGEENGSAKKKKKNKSNDGDEDLQTATKSEKKKKKSKN